MEYGDWLAVFCHVHKSNTIGSVHYSWVTYRTASMSRIGNTIECLGLDEPGGGGLLPGRQQANQIFKLLILFLISFLIRFYFQLPNQKPNLYSFLLQSNSLCAQCPQFFRFNIANGRGANAIDIVICYASSLLNVRAVVS